MQESSQILSCVILDKDPAHAKRTFDLLDQYSFIHVVKVYTNMMDAITFLSQRQPMFLVIDTGMLIENGNYHIINKVLPESRVVVTGSGDDDFIRTMTTGSYHYIDKPLHKPKILEVIRKIYQEHLATNADSGSNREYGRSERNGLFVKGDTGYVRIDFDEIDYIKAFGEYAKLYKGDKWVLLLCTLKKITEQLPRQTFARVHRSFTVRIGSIRSFDAHEIRIGDQFVPIGRNYKKEFESALLTLA